MNIETRFEFGDPVAESVTGIVGTITSVVISMGGLTRYCVEWVDDQGVDNCQWYNESRLELRNAGETVD